MRWGGVEFRGRLERSRSSAKAAVASVFAKALFKQVRHRATQTSPSASLVPYLPKPSRLLGRRRLHCKSESCTRDALFCRQERLLQRAS